MRMLLLVGAMLVVLMPPASATPATCIEPLTEITAPTSLDFELACEAVATARAVLAEMGFDTRVPVTILVKPRVEVALNDTLMHQVFGQYDRTTGIIEVTDVDHHRGMAKVKPAFGLPFNLDVQRALVIHEVAHAVAEANFDKVKPSRVAHEYIAYVAQIATMPADIRERVIAEQNTEAFDSDLAINEMILAMKPDLFAVKAYLHYIEPGNGLAFLNRLLTGDFRPDAGHWY